MGAKPHKRGKQDTRRDDALHPSLRWALGLTTSRRALVIIGLVALLVHVPMLPNPFTGWFEGWLSKRQFEEPEGEVFIPIDFTLDEPPGDTTGSLPDNPPPAEPDPPPSDGSPDGGDEDGVKVPIPEAPPDPPPPPPEPPPEDTADPPPPEPVGPPEERVVDEGPPNERDPLEIAGVDKSLTPHPNVTVWLVGKNLRSHVLGQAFASLLTSIPEWQRFFKGTGIDPIADIDNLIITGPRLRISKEVVVVLSYSKEPDAMRGAVDTLVQRSEGGKWIEDAPVPTAEAIADRAKRYFAFNDPERLIVIFPEVAKDQVERVSKMKRPATPQGAGIMIHAVTPWRIFMNTSVINLSESLQWVRLTVVPLEDGSAEVHLHLLDDTPEHAKENAAAITRMFGGFSAFGLAIRAAGLPTLAGVEFKANGTKIEGSTTVPRQEIENLIQIVNDYLAGNR